MPVFYFEIPKQNTVSVFWLQALHNIQVKTGRTVIIVSAWPYWPPETAKDRFFKSFIEQLNPKLRYVWIPFWLERVIHKLTLKIWTLLQIQDVLYRPMGLNSTIRFSGKSTLNVTDILHYNNERVVFSIPKSHENVLEEKLKQLGIAPGEWFVCVHAREHGWHRDMKAYGLDHASTYRHEQEDHRNVDIRDYYPAMDYIRSKGGKIVRMGDPSMTRVTDVEGLIDYPFTEHWSLPMDLYIVSKCRFVLGCQSGFSSAFPIAFGKPLLVTNYTAPLHTVEWPYSNNIFMFMTMRENETNRVLSLKETFHPDVCLLNNTVECREMGYQWISNTPDDILESTKEMLQLINNDSFEGPMTKEQEAFHLFRLAAIDSMFTSESRSIHRRHSDVRAAASRISASFAAHHFANEELVAGLR